ncbi:unnamed protein product, partial [Brassica rapa]
DVLCVLTDSHRQPQTSCVRWRTPTDVLCVLNRQPTWAKITQTVHGKGQCAERHVCAGGHPRTSSTDVMCVLADTHGRPVCTDQTAHDQSADMCTDGQPQTSYTNTHGHTRTATNVLCVLTDSHGQPRTQPTWAKITQTVHGKGQHAESKDQRADMCTDGQPRMSYSPRGPKSPKQSTGRVNVLSPRTNVLICALMDSHERPVCANGHTHTNTDSPRRPVQPTWAKITRTVHGKGQRAESKDQCADMCTDRHPRTSCPRTATDVLCALPDTHGCPVCTEQTAHPQMSCVCWRTPTDVLCVLTRQPTWAKITRTVHRKGQRAESKDQRADMCTDGQPQTSCVCWRTPTDILCTHMDTHGRPVCADGQPQTATDLLCVLADIHGRPVCTEQIAHMGQNHPNSPQEGPACRVEGPTC